MGQSPRKKAIMASIRMKKSGYNPNKKYTIGKKKTKFNIVARKVAHFEEKKGFGKNHANYIGEATAAEIKNGKHPGKR